MNDSTTGAESRRRAPWAAILLCAVLLAGIAGILWRSQRTQDHTAAQTVSAPVSSPAALAETTGEEGTLRIEVVSLERLSPGTLELRLAITHIGTEQTALDIAQRFSADGPDRGTLSEVYLADLAHQRKLFIMRDTEGVPIGSRDERPLSPAERREVWAHFPTPSDGEDVVVVHVPHAEPMPNVPIAEAEAAEAPATPEHADAPAGEPGA